MSKTVQEDSNLCRQACPYRLAWLGTSLRVRGKLTLREKEIIVLYLYTLLTVSYAGFFAESQIMFFLLTSFPFCPPLKNDGRGELLCHDILMINEYIKKSIGNVSRPRLSGKVAAEPSEGASVRRNGKMILTCVRKLTPIASQGSALPSEFGGS